MILMSSALFPLVTTVIYRVSSCIILWFLMPPIFLVFLAWILLRDCDFALLIARALPGYSNREHEFFFGRVCWVTGASSSIGRTLAINLARLGAFVILSGENETQLIEVAEACDRSFLVSEIRACNRSEEKINIIIRRANDLRKSRVMLLPVDIANAPNMNTLVRAGLSWRGRIDVLFNDASLEENQEFFQDHLSSKVDLFDKNCVGCIRLIKALIPSCLEDALPLPKLPSLPEAGAIQLRFPDIRKMSTTEFTSFTERMKRNVGLLSSKSFEKGRKITHVIYDFFYPYLYGFRPKYKRTFHIVNILSTSSRLQLPGGIIYSASKIALGQLINMLRLELDSAAKSGEHHTQVTVTNCFPGANFIRNNNHLTSSHNATKTNKYKTYTEMLPERCVELIIRGTAHSLSECWIATQPDIIWMYIAYYLPGLWSYLLDRRFGLSHYNKLKELSTKLKVPSKKDD